MYCKHAQYIYPRTKCGPYKLLILPQQPKTLDIKLVSFDRNNIRMGENMLVLILAWDFF